MDIVMTVGALTLLLIIIGARPLARWFTRRTGTQVITVEPVLQSPLPESSGELA